MTQHNPAIGIRISETLRDIFGKHSVFPQADVSVKTAKVESGLPSLQAQITDWQLHVLRRDGQRPLRFMGLRLMSWEQNVQDGTRLFLDLYTAVDGSVIAHYAINPSNVIAAREVLKGQDIPNVDVMKEFLTSCAPDACLHVHPMACSRQTKAQTEALAVIQTAFAELLAVNFFNA